MSQYSMSKKDLLLTGTERHRERKKKTTERCSSQIKVLISIFFLNRYSICI